MDKSERLELIQTLVESGKTDEEILKYLKETVNLTLSDTTLKKDIKDVREQFDAVPEQEPIEEEIAQSSEQEPESQEELEADAESGPSQEDEDESTIELLKSQLKQGQEDELWEDAKEKLDKVAYERFTRLVAVAKGRIDLEISEKKKEQALDDLSKFRANLAKSVDPAIGALEEAQGYLKRAIQFKRKEGKNVKTLTAVSKVLNRQIKALDRQISG